MKRDVGMAWQKITQTRKCNPSLHLFYYSCALAWERCRDEALYIYLHFYILPSLFVLVLACHPFHFIVYLVPYMQLVHCVSTDWSVLTNYCMASPSPLWIVILATCNPCTSLMKGPGHTCNMCQVSLIPGTHCLHMCLISPRCGDSRLFSDTSMLCDMRLWIQ